MALPIIRQSYIPTLLALLAYTSIGVLLFPLISSDRIHFGRVDNLLILYTLEWERYALLADPGQFFDGIMFHSLGPSLFFTHLVLGGLPIYMAGYLFGGAIHGYHAVVIVSPIFNAVAMYFLARKITDQPWSAFLAGCVFAFSPISLHFAQFTNLSIFWWSPLALICLISFLRNPRWWTLGAAWFCILTQFATATYLGFIALSAAIIFASFALLHPLRQFPPLRTTCIGVAGCVVVTIPFVPILLGYIEFGLDIAETRSIADIQVLSARLPRFLPWINHEQSWHALVRNTGLADLSHYVLFPGILSLVIGITGFTVSVVRRKHLSTALPAALFVCVMFALTLGPTFFWQDQQTSTSLPWHALYKWLPGFASFRNPTFFAPGIMLGLSLLVALAIDHLPRTARLRWISYGLIILILGLVTLESHRPPIGSSIAPRQPELEQALLEISTGPIVFLPVDIGDSPEPNMQRGLWSLLSSRSPILNGYSGYEPRGYSYLQYMVDSASLLSQQQVVLALQALGIQTLVFDHNYLEPEMLEGWLRSLVASDTTMNPIKTHRFTIAPLTSGNATTVTGWAQVHIDLAVTSTLIDAEVVVPIVFTNRSPYPWVPPPGRRARTAEAVWIDAGGVEHSHSTVILRPPPIITANSVATALTPLSLKTPLAAGLYTVKLTEDDDTVATQTITVRNSTDRPPHYSMAAKVQILDAPSCIRLADPVPLIIRSLNSGAVAWDGNIRLGYRWETPGEVANDPPVTEGRLFMPFEDRNSRWQTVPTGSEFVFTGTATTPKFPGHFQLVIGMVEEGVQWFGNEYVELKILPASGLPSHCI